MSRIVRRQNSIHRLTDDYLFTSDALSMSRFDTIWNLFEIGGLPKISYCHQSIQSIQEYVYFRYYRCPHQFQLVHVLKYAEPHWHELLWIDLQSVLLAVQRVKKKFHRHSLETSLRTEGSPCQEKILFKRNSHGTDFLSFYHSVFLSFPLFLFLSFCHFVFLSFWLWSS